MNALKPLLAALVLTCSIGQAHAQSETIADLPASAIFVVSSGMWEQEPAETAPQQPQATAAADPTRGYYKVAAIRQGDGTARIYLQQLAFTANGPQLVETVELEEFSQMKAYVTDIRTDNSSGASDVPGLFVTVYLKTDPMAKESENWTIMIDELGDMKIEKASN